MSISNNNEAKNGQNNQQQPQNQTKNENNKPETFKENGCALNQTQINKLLNSVKTSTVQSQQSDDKLNVQIKNSINLRNHNALSPEILDKFNELLKLKEIKFSIDKLNKLEDMINRDRWVIPVLPKHELETLLIESIDLAKQGKF